MHVHVFMCIARQLYNHGEGLRSGLTHNRVRESYKEYCKEYTHCKTQNLAPIWVVPYCDSIWLVSLILGFAMLFCHLSYSTMSTIHPYYTYIVGLSCTYVQSC